MPHIVFSGGGTAGHLFPGLALAEQLESLARITFVGSGKEFESRHVAAAGFEYRALPCQPLPTRLGKAWRFVWDQIKSRQMARRLIRRERVAAVVGLGGYASVPMARAAIAAGVPLLLMEQNAVAGRATRWLAPSAEMICLAMDEARVGIRSAAPMRTLGNPTRAQFGHLFLHNNPVMLADAPRRTRQLLVLGGSGGARALNEALPRALYKLKSKLAGWTIVHQTGRADEAETRRLYETFDLPAMVAAFIDDMPAVLANTSLAICRAGGTSLAELALAGVPAILSPYPQAVNNHQRRNANVYAAAGAALIVDQREVVGRTDDAFAAAIAQLLGDTAKQRSMSVAMKQLARPDAAWHAASLILDAASSRRPTAA